MAKQAMTFEIYKDANGQYRWRAVHRNGRIKADSGEGYTRRGRCATALTTLLQDIGKEDYKIKFI